MIAIDNANTNGYVGLCLEVHDLLISKYFAGREKDYEFCAAVVVADLADQEQLHPDSAFFLFGGRDDRIARAAAPAEVFLQCAALDQVPDIAECRIR